MVVWELNSIIGENLSIMGWNYVAATRLGEGDGVADPGLLAPTGRLPRAMIVGAATRLGAPTARGCFSLDKSRGRGQKRGRRSEFSERPEGRSIVAGLDVSEEVGEAGGIHFLDFGFEA